MDIAHRLRALVPRQQRITRLDVGLAQPNTLPAHAPFDEAADTEKLPRGERQPPVRRQQAGHLPQQAPAQGVAGEVMQHRQADHGIEPRVARPIDPAGLRQVGLGKAARQSGEIGCLLGGQGQQTRVAVDPCVVRSDAGLRQRPGKATVAAAHIEHATAGGQCFRQLAGKRHHPGGQALPRAVELIGDDRVELAVQVEQALLDSLAHGQKFLVVSMVYYAR